MGADPITAGWNQLLRDAAAGQQGEQQTRVPAALDQEAITLARAMRGLAGCLGHHGYRRRHSLPRSGCLRIAEALPEQENHAGRDLPELIGLRDETDETAAAALSRMLGPIRMLHERRTIRGASHPLHVRITRSRLSGRSGDGEGLAWVLTDITQQQIAMESRDQFLMTATHELRTPLNNLQAYAETLLEEQDLEIERQKEFCNVINSEANRLGRSGGPTPHRQPDGSRLDGGEPTRTGIASDARVRRGAARGQAEQKRMTLTTNLSAKLPTVLGDRDKLQAALVNLVGNAIKYTPEHGQVVASLRRR